MHAGRIYTGSDRRGCDRNHARLRRVSGAHEGVLVPSEVCITSTNRNFPGRMGATDAQLYLASPATVAASMVRGEITDPRDFL